ncbi:MAG: aldo/keto reductase [Candidatus Bathyarchaeia archaeon]
MQYRFVPKNGDKLSVLGFGCMRLPLNGQAIDEPRAIRQIRLAIDNGVNYVDTAPPYHGGESEVVLGKALLGGYREKVKVATKLTPSMLNKPEDMQKMLDGQLQKLQTDHIDYYLVHSLDDVSWSKMQSFGVLKFLEKAKADGKIVNICFSFHGTLETFKEIVDAYDWVMCQIQYNFLDEKMQAGTEGMRYAASKNLAVVVMEPLRGGSLTCKVPVDVQKVYDSANVQWSPAEWALRWVWNHPEVTLALSGMNDEAQVRENIKIGNVALPNSMTPGQLAVIKKVEAAYRNLIKIPCTGCGYCMPCPAGVDIPRNFQLYNDYCMFDDEQQTRSLYALVLMGGIGTERCDASLCQDCKQCVARCPQHIDVSGKLWEVSDKLGGPKTEAIAAMMKSQRKES